MQSYAVPAFLVYLTMFFILICLGTAIFFILRYISILKKDVIIFLDKNNRFNIKYGNVSGDSIKDGKKTYYINRDGSPINRKGKGLFIFSENRPEPLSIRYNKKSEWADSETLMSMINNDMAKVAFQLDQLKKNSMLELLSMISGLIAGAGVILLILVEFGVVNVG